MLRRRKARQEKSTKQPDEEIKVSKFSLQTDSGSKGIEEYRLKHGKRSR